MALTKVSRGLLSTSIVDNGNATAITIDASENVGIGTSSPTGKLHIGSGSSSAAISGSADELVLDNAGNAGITIATGSSAIASLFFADAASNASGYIQYTHSNDALAFATNNSTEAMRIDASGNVGIGVTPESWNTYKTLQIGNGAIANYAPTHDMRMVSNAYYNSGWKYAESDCACLYLQDGDNSTHIWSVVIIKMGESRFQCLEPEAAGIPCGVQRGGSTCLLEAFKGSSPIFSPYPG